MASVHEPARPRRADAARSRARILDAAARLFERDSRATMAQVAAAAGVGRSTLHRHFRTRMDLERALTRAGSAGDVLPAGRLGRAEPLPLEALHVLDEIPPHLVAEQLVAEARRTAGVPVALYVIDIDGSALLRLAGEAGELPDRLDVPLGLGQEIAPDSLPALYEHLERHLPGCSAAPLWLRGRATGVLLAVGRTRSPLTEIARQGAAALELANRYTDAFEAVRRRRATSPAAEMQLNLVPDARILQVGGGELAGGLLASPEVGGDWFDFAENRDGTWLAIADAAGEGPVAAGRAAVSLGALRSARRRGLGLGPSAQVIQQTVLELGEAFTVSAVLARWQAPTATFSWIACGHPAPLLVDGDGAIVTLDEADGEPALGIGDRDREFRPHERRLSSGERVILCSDGLLERRGDDGEPFGVAGVQRAVAAAPSASAAATARQVQHAAVAVANRPLEDDVVVVALAAG
jgi:serine phosphatase RsbU (regulator of sigma subunit)/AraC-like DNA-binding protein